MKRLSTTILGSTLLLWASVAGATATLNHDIDTTEQYPGHLIGSDTLNELMDSLIADMIANDAGYHGAYSVYDGLGSSVGERQLAGSPTGSDPTCTPADATGGDEGNPGCQEIAPMSRELQSGICDDDRDGMTATGGTTFTGGSNATAEGIAACKDGIVVITDNASLGEYGDTAAAGAGGNGSCEDFAALPATDNTDNVFLDHGVGNLANAGTVDLGAAGPDASDYTIGSGSFTGGNAWKDVLRIVYTGLSNTQGSGTADRVGRCGSELRQKLMQDWHLLFEGVDCGAPGNACNNVATPADGGLRQVYRRDDGSGTSGTFLELLGVLKDPANLANRGSLVSGFPLAITAMPANLSFCDGGQVEGFMPTGFDGSGNPLFTLGDPIRKPCKPEDDLCAFDGRAPVVRSIRSTITVAAGQPGPYPIYQCSKGLFAKRNFISTILKVCPDGTKPSAGQCKFPYFKMPDLSKNFDCLNQKGSIPSTVPGTTDGRSYNYVLHSSTGDAVMAATNLPQVASWRQNMAAMNSTFGANNGFAFGGALGGYVCNEDDATRNIGCIVGHTTCTLGFSGREAGYTASNDNDLTQEPVQLQDHGPSDSEILAGTFPFARSLWLNASHGFENLTDDCLGRGGSTDECDDELAIALEFYNYAPSTEATPNRLSDYCTASGFIPMPAAVCRGATTSAGCGAPTSQDITDCQPL